MNDGRCPAKGQRSPLVARLSSAFDAAAPTYDERYSAKANALMAWLRHENLTLMKEIFPTGGHLLEIGCGTGEEAVALAQAGYRVLATDVSPRMVALTMRRARAAGVAHRVQGVALAAGDLEALCAFQAFDAAYASFGSLNCEPRLPAVAQALARLLKPGAAFVCSVMARWCPFEVAWFALHGRWRQATRRWPRGWHEASLALGNGHRVLVPTRYVSPGEVARAFAPHFVVERTLAFPLLLPPPYLDNLYRRFPHLWRQIERIERAIRDKWPWNQMGDHVLMVLRRQPPVLGRNADRAVSHPRLEKPHRGAGLLVRCRGPVSAAPTVTDLDGDGSPEIVVAADALYVCRADGALLPGFPVRGKNAFASRPALGDINGDGQMEIVVGCDDNRVYAVDARGRALPGWPISTHGDVYSSPALADLDSDGRLEIVVGSDDGRVYAWRGDGTLLPGWPQQTDGFVASSPRVADINGDGQVEVVVGSWDGGVYAWQGDGRQVDGWPRFTNHFVWASPALVDVDGDGQLEVFIASDRVYGWRADGTPLAGWPQETASYCVASPLLVDVDGDGRLEVVQAADRVYAWRVDGAPLPGFPLDLGTFFWATPTWIPGTGLVLNGWNGRTYLVDVQGQARVLATFSAPLFAPPVLADLDRGGNTNIIIAGWDGGVYRISPDRHIVTLANSEESKFEWPTVHVGEGPGFVGEVPAGVAPLVVLPVEPGPRAVLWYRAQHESAWHPVPLVVHAARLTGLVQPFPRGTEVMFFAQVLPPERGNGAPLPGRRLVTPPSFPGTYRYPPTGEWRIRFHEDWSARVRRWRTRAWSAIRQVSRHVQPISKT